MLDRGFSRNRPGSHGLPKPGLALLGEPRALTSFPAPSKGAHLTESRSSLCTLPFLHHSSSCLQHNIEIMRGGAGG